MDMRQLPSRYARLVEGTWRELPANVASFIQEVAAAVSAPAPLVEEALFELLPFDNMAQLQRFADTLAVIFMPMSQRWPDTPLPDEAGPFNRYTDALVHAALDAVAAGGLAAIGQLPAKVALPETARAFDTDRVEELGHAVLELREMLLDGFTVFHGASLSVPAVRHALDLADVLSRYHLEAVPQLAEWILEARGAAPIELVDLEAIWDADNEDEALREWSWAVPEEDALVDSRAEMLADEYGGNAQVARLRPMTRGFSPFARQLLEDDSTPALVGVLAFAPGHARFAVKAVAEGPQEYLAPQISRYGYVPQVADIAALLRCSGSIPVTVEVVSLELAEELDCPELAGWYRLDWGQCF
jgi:hypothetical protein